MIEIGPELAKTIQYIAAGIGFVLVIGIFLKTMKDGGIRLPY